MYLLTQLLLEDDDDDYFHEDVEDVLEHVIYSERVQFPPLLPGKGLPSTLCPCV